MRSSLLFLAFVSVFELLLFGQNNNYVPDPAWKAPLKASEARNPLKDSPEALRKGHNLYEEQCSLCHGGDGQGLNNAANFHVAAVQRQSDGTFFWKITNGNPDKGMPAFKTLSDKDRWSLVAYLRTFKTNKK